MDFERIEPFVRHIEKRDDCAQAGITLASYDHIFLYVVRGEVEITIAAEKYTMRENSLFFIRSGTAYQVTDKGRAVYIRMHFDFGHRHRIDCPTYLKPVAISEFDRSGIVEKDDFAECGFGECFYLEEVYELEQYFQQILLEENQQDKYFDTIGSAFVKIVLAHAGRRLDWKRQNITRSKNDVVDEIVEYIYRNIGKDITNELIGKTFGFHPKYLNALFEKETGYSIHKFVQVKRISKAIEYMQTTKLRICEIAELLGFSDEKYFAKVFKKLVGKTPQEYKKLVDAAHN